MEDNFIRFTKKKEYLICIDSDGCAMDTMDLKHKKCFGPCMIKEWALESHAQEIQKSWNEVNLYTRTRGINRFQGLARALRETDSKYGEIPGIDELEHWAESTDELSERSLQRAASDPGITEEGRLILNKALSWSRAVNDAIDRIPDDEKKPFTGVRDALEAAGRKADIAIVSSANRKAVEDEWSRYGLLTFTDILLTQKDGSKAACIGRLLEKGYDRSHALMAGDAPGDARAAGKNGIFFYPVLVGHEEESWKEFKNEALAKLTDETYAGAYQKKKLDEFWSNL
ncbi:HAD family hydrolase [Murimonas intestini]|uniref:HAD family hydrolase n=1 Tax=Murimonas intestini TaxID=1337051 RepID=UPI0011DE2D0B|nr:HAD hydrolase-like protein [Murimonas intestini]